MPQAPASRRGVSKLIVDRSYRWLDLSPFSHARSAESKPMVEKTFTDSPEAMGSVESGRA